MQSFEHTKGSIYFTLGGVPTVIRPSSWIMLFIFGAIFGGDLQNFSPVLIFVVGGMLCLLVHEFGHAFTCRLLGGGDLAIEIASLGGTTYCGRQPRTNLGKLIMTLAGAGASLALAGICGVLMGLHIGAMGSGLSYCLLGPIPFVDLSQQVLSDIMSALYSGEASRFSIMVFGIISSICVWWSIFNLLPIYPLDGGKAVFLITNNARTTSLIGVICAVAMCIWCFWSKNIYLGMLCGYFAYMNWMFLRNNS